MKIRNFFKSKNELQQRIKELNTKVLELEEDIDYEKEKAKVKDLKKKMKGTK